LDDCHFCGRDELGMSPGIWPVNLPLLDREKWLRNGSTVSNCQKIYFFDSLSRVSDPDPHGSALI
jgi:hypothetical protein